MDKVLFTDNTPKTANELATFLRTVADKIESGGLTLTKGDNLLELEFPKDFGFRFKVKDDIGRSSPPKRKVQIGFRWTVGQEGGTKAKEEMVIS